MNCLKKRHSVSLFLLALIATLEICNTFRIAQIKTAIDEFEPVVIERIKYVQYTEPTISEEPEITHEPKASELEVFYPYIDCYLNEFVNQYF